MSMYMGVIRVLYCARSTVLPTHPWLELIELQDKNSYHISTFFDNVLYQTLTAALLGGSKDEEEGGG